jgi:hypothetical protein
MSGSGFMPRKHRKDDVEQFASFEVMLMLLINQSAAVAGISNSEIAAGLATALRKHADPITNPDVRAALADTLEEIAADLRVKPPIEHDPEAPLKRALWREGEARLAALRRG